MYTITKYGGSTPPSPPDTPTIAPIYISPDSSPVGSPSASSDGLKKLD